MMDALRSWLLGVVFTAFATGLAVELIPKGRERALVKMICGMLMALAMLRPLGAVQWEKDTIPAGNFTRRTQQQAEYYRTEQEKTLSAIIAERTETYIWDKAREMGLECTVRVIVSVGESSVPLPETVELDAVYDPALAVWIEEVVGIPAEKQIWLEEYEWGRKTENG